MLAASVDEAADRGFELLGSSFAAFRALEGSLVCAAEPVLVVVMRTFEQREPSHVGIDGGLLEHERVAGCRRLHLGEGCVP